MSNLSAEYLAPYFSVYCAAVHRVLPMPPGDGGIWNFTDLVAACLQGCNLSDSSILGDWYNMCLARSECTRLVGSWYRAAMDFTVGAKADSMMNSVWDRYFPSSDPESNSQSWMFHWWDSWQQQLFLSFVLQAPLFYVGVRPSAAYECRTLMGIQRRIQDDGIALEDAFCESIARIVRTAQQRVRINAPQNGQAQYIYRTYSTWTATPAFKYTGVAAEPVHPFESLKAWAVRGISVKANEAIANVGLSLWPSAFLLAEYLFVNATHISELLSCGGKPLSIIELGAGAGLTAILGRCVIPNEYPYHATDYLWKVLELLQINLNDLGMQVRPDNEDVTLDLSTDDESAETCDEEEFEELMASIRRRMDAKVQDYTDYSSEYDQCKHVSAALQRHVRELSLARLVSDAMSNIAHANAATEATETKMPGPDTSIAAGLGNEVHHVADRTNLENIQAKAQVRIVNVSTMNWSQMHECVSLSEKTTEDELLSALWNKYQYGLVIAADCIYGPELAEHFSKAVSLLLKAAARSPESERPKYEPHVIMAMQLRAPETYALFREIAPKMGLEIEMLDLASIPHLFVDAYSRQLMMIMKISLRKHD